MQQRSSQSHKARASKQLVPVLLLFVATALSSANDAIAKDERTQSVLLSRSSRLQDPAQSESARQEGKPSQNEGEGKAESSETGDKDEIERVHWPQALKTGPETLFYFTEAISGKKLKPQSSDLLRGVTEVAMKGQRIVFTRMDNEQLELGPDTAHGAEVLKDWEKAQKNAAKQFGPKGEEFLKSIEAIRLVGDRVEVLRKGEEELSIVMGERKLHHAFDLRGLRFRKISFLIDSSGDHPFLKDIEGVTVLINAPGFSFPVEVKEFHKKKDPKGTDLTVGVRNPVPGAIRAFLFMPAVIRFRFHMPKKD